MSRTIVLSGEEVTTGKVVAELIRDERSRDGSLSPFEHDILSGIESSLINDDGLSGDELGFVGTAALAAGAGLRAVVKGKALKKVFGFVGKIKNKIKARRAKRAASNAAPLTPEENQMEKAIVQTFTNIQADAQSGSAKYAKVAAAEESGLPAPVESSGGSTPVVFESPSAPVQKPNWPLIFGIGAALYFVSKK